MAHLDEELSIRLPARGARPFNPGWRLLGQVDICGVRRSGKLLPRASPQTPSQSALAAVGLAGDRPDSGWRHGGCPSTRSSNVCKRTRCLALRPRQAKRPAANFGMVRASRRVCRRITGLAPQRNDRCLSPRSALPFATSTRPRRPLLAEDELLTKSSPATGGAGRVLLRIALPLFHNLSTKPGNWPSEFPAAFVRAPGRPWP